MNSKPVVNGVYEHINNGGVSFEVTNENGPTVVISASHFGNQTNQMKLHVTKKSLMNLAEMFKQASEYVGYDEEYVCAARTSFYDKENGKILKEGLEEMTDSICFESTESA